MSRDVDSNDDPKHVAQSGLGMATFHIGGYPSW